MQSSLIVKKTTQPKNSKDKGDDYELFHGGEGLSKNSPVSIDCTSMEVAKTLMNKFIIDTCGEDYYERTDFEYTIENPNNKDKQIISLRFGISNGDDMTLEKLGLTREYVRQIQNKVLDKLRGHPSLKFLKDYQED